MNFRDCATSAYIELESVLRILDDIPNAGDFDEAIADAQEAASEIRSVMESLNQNFELSMDED